jgi:hypothetical protein
MAEQRQISRHAHAVDELGTHRNPYTERLNKTHKYVVSNTLSEPLPWVNSTLLKDLR